MVDRSPATVPRSGVRALFRERRGTSAVEFALILPVLFFLLVGVIEGGLFLGMVHALEQISANGGRFAIGGLSPDERRTMAESWIRGEADHYALLERARLTTTTRERDGVLTVTLSYDASNLQQYALLGSMLGFPKRIERSATMLLP